MKRTTSAPLFADWSHTRLQVASPPCDFPAEPFVFPKTTVTQGGFVAMCIPSLVQPAHLRGPTPAIHCWTRTSTESTANPQQEISKAIVQQYQQCIPGISLAARVNPTVADFEASFERVKVVPGKRFLFHYIASGLPDTTGQGMTLLDHDKPNHHHSLVQKVMTRTAPCAVHIIDCDYAGLLAQSYNAFISGRAESPNPVDMFVFFACGAQEKLPRSPGLPCDLFTSCITTPARTALLWHSRHYYCFKDGPLRPLDPDFYERAPQKILTEICVILHRVVEAMAYEVFPTELYLKVFHTDTALAHFAANFFLAARILSFFEVTPSSIPAMPELRGHQLWDSFDLRLDVALLQLNSPSPAPSLTYVAFLEQAVQTLKNLMAVNRKDVSFASQLTYMPSILATPSLKEVGCDVLAQYIDTSTARIRHVLEFAIVVPLFRLLIQGHVQESLLFSMAKIMIFLPDTKRILISSKKNVFEELIFPLFSSQKPLFALIIAVMTLKDSEDQIAGIDGLWKKHVLPLLSHSHSDVRVWTLLLMSVFISKVTGGVSAIDDVIRLLDDDCFHVRLVAVYVLGLLAGKEKDDLIVDSVVGMTMDLAPAVRVQVVTTLNKFVQDERIQGARARLSKDRDPHVVKQLAVPIGAERSYVFEWFCSCVLGPVRAVIVDPALTLSDVWYVDIRTPGLSIGPLVSVRKFTKVRAIKSQHAISSNLMNVDGGQFTFGTKAGEICVCSWGAGQRRIRISTTPICHIEHADNAGFPMTMIANTGGYLYSVQVPQGELNLLNGFQVTSGAFTFSYDDYNRRLYAVPYVEEKRSVLLFDMVKEKRMMDIIPKNGAPKVARAISGREDIIAVCSSCLEFFDLRSGNQPVLTFDDSYPPAYDVTSVRCIPTSFALCHTIPVVSMIDIRAEKCCQRIDVGPSTLETISFSVQSESASVALGTSNGLFVSNLLSGESIDLADTLLKTGKDPLPVTQSVFHPSKSCIAILQDLTEILTLTSDDK